MEELTIPQSLPEWNARGREYPPGHLGIEILELADTCCGYATVRNLPEGAEVRADGSGKQIAQFRCTQMILYPR